MDSSSIATRWLLLVVFLMSSVVPASAAPPLIERLLAPLKRHGRAPEMNQDDCVEELARNIDWLEHNIDRYGSIVAKTPDVWGEARLTKYRREVEDQLAGQIDKFQVTLNGAQATRDLAMLATAISFGGGTASESGFGDLTQVTIDEGGIEPSAPELGNFGMIGDSDLFAAGQLEIEPVTRLNQMRRYLNHLNELRRINEGDDAADAPGYSLNLIRVPVSVLPGSKTTHGHGAEITMTAKMEMPDHLLAETYRDLVINDLVDQLSLPMTRFLNSDPIRVARLLNGFYADQNQERAIEEFIKFVERSPLVLRSKGLVPQIRGQMDLNSVGDLTYFQFTPNEIRLCLPTLGVNYSKLKEEMAIFATYIRPVLLSIEVLNQASRSQVLAAAGIECQDTIEKEQCERVVEAYDILRSYGIRYDFANRVADPVIVLSPDTAKAELQKLINPLSKQIATLQKDLKSHQEKSNAHNFEEIPPGKSEKDRLAPFDPTDTDESAIIDGSTNTPEGFGGGVAKFNTIGDPVGSIAGDISRRTVSLQGRNLLEGLTELSQSLADDFEQAAATTTIPSSLSRRSTLPYPPSELIDILGGEGLGWLVLQAHEAFRIDAINRRVVHLVDVQAFLREELTSAYALLSQPEMQHLWQSESTQGLLAGSIRSHLHQQVVNQRSNFYAALPPETLREPTGVLAWAVMVQSVLLNERMNESIAKKLGAVHCSPGHPLPFYGPSPPRESIEAFNAYVAARWPLRIFTVDPVSDDQNIADTSAIARQMQFAAAFAVASGEMRPSAALNFARNIERDFATVSLNQTAVGFVHGDDTFGWRFSPRFQTPPVQNNGVVIVRDLILGGPTDNALRRQRRIEAGMRECVALVLTPSFVTGLTIDTRSNWYRINKPGHSLISMQEFAELSRGIQSMRHSAKCCIRRPDHYRDGDVTRMLRRVEQLEQELPLQTLECQVPNSNTLGGFEILAGGVRELAPELLGWYGSPGYQVGGDAQTFYLVGDNFSVHETEVIVGTHKAATRLLSRQILEVTLQGNVPVISDGRLNQLQFGNGDASNDYAGYVDAHVATPYGVSGHLLIPALPASKTPSPPKPTLSTLPAGQAGSAQIQITMKRDNGQLIADGPMQISHLPIARINVPETINTARAGLLEQTVDVVLTPVAGPHRLAAATLASVPVSKGQLNLGSPRLYQALQPKGDLHSSIAAYANWLVNARNGFPAMDATPSEPVDLSMIVSIRRDRESEATAVGTVPVRLVFDLL